MQSFDGLSAILVLVHVDDPLASDPEFHRVLRYSGACSVWPMFSAKEAAELRHELKNKDQDTELTAGHYVIEIYTNMFQHFIQMVLPNSQYVRSLTFTDQMYLDHEDERDEIPAHVYTIKTEGERKLSYTVIDEDSDEDLDDTPQGDFLLPPRIIH